MSDRRHYMTSERDGKGGSGRNHRDQKERDHRAEIQKTAIRVCGDWSEHISSSGKKYFYNCKTEQSQWEVPQDWVERPSNRPSRNDNGRDERHERDSRHPKAGSSYRGADDRHRHHHHLKHQRGPDRYDRPDRHHDRHERERERYHNTHKPAANHHPNNSYPGGHSNRRENDRRENEDTRETEDMDISPGSTPTEESVFERTMTVNHPSTSTPSSAVNSNMSLGNMSSGSTPRSSASVIETLNSLPQNVLSHLDADKKLRSLNNQQMTQQAIRTLAKLQQALQQAQQQQQRQVQTLLVQQIKQQIDQAQQQSKAPLNSVMDEGSQSPYSPPDSDGTPLHSPEPRPSSNVLVRVQDEDPTRGHGSPCQSDVSLKSSSKRGSPAPSHSSSQSVPVATSQLVAAHRKNDDSVQLTPSLANYYNDKLIDHVSNKAAEVIEGQCDRVREDGLHVGSVQCTQVSAELKRDRSLVRLAEIQCTLQEQRVLFLRQQIKELENL